jgi:hypothetical protein
MPNTINMTFTGRFLTTPVAARAAVVVAPATESYIYQATPSVVASKSFSVSSKMKNLGNTFNSIQVKKHCKSCGAR